MMTDKEFELACEKGWRDLVEITIPEFDTALKNTAERIGIEHALATKEFIYPLSAPLRYC